MAKMGRPKADSPKVKSVGIRLSDEEYKKLKQYTDEHNLTITEVVLKGLKILFNKP